MTPMLQMLFSANDALRAVSPGVLVVFGATLRAIAPRYRVTVEERVRDRRMSETDARFAMSFVRWSWPALTLLGLLLVGLAFFNVGQ